MPSTSQQSTRTALPSLLRKSTRYVIELITVLYPHVSQPSLLNRCVVQRINRQRISTKSKLRKQGQTTEYLSTINPNTKTSEPNDLP